MDKQRPADDDPVQRKLTDTDIVTGLRSEKPERRVEALQALCGLNGGVFILSGVKEQRITVTNNLNAGWVFPVLLRIVQHVGARLGLKLDWISEGPPPAPGIVVAQPEHLPPTPP